MGSAEKRTDTKKVVKAIFYLIGITALHFAVMFLLYQYALRTSQAKYDKVKAFPPSDQCKIDVLLWDPSGQCTLKYQMEDAAEKEAIMEALSELEYGGYYGLAYLWLYHERPEEPGRSYSVSVSCAQEDYYAWISLGVYSHEISDKIVRVSYADPEPALRYLDGLLLE